MAKGPFRRTALGSWTMALQASFWSLQVVRGAKEEFWNSIYKRTSARSFPNSIKSLSKRKRNGEEFTTLRPLIPLSCTHMSVEDSPVTTVDKALVAQLPYTSVVGHLQFHTTCTRQTWPLLCPNSAHIWRAWGPFKLRGCLCVLIS